MFAPTLPGYGRAEKPSLPYGQVCARHPPGCAGACLPSLLPPVHATAAACPRHFFPPSPPYPIPPTHISLPKQDLWASFLADFCRDVVRRPVVAAGNSIGGFLAASLAADAPPGAVSGLVLLNSAGQIDARWAPPRNPPRARAPPVWLADALSAALFSFLEGDVARQLVRLYPVAPARADDWLATEIARAARDPGALGVFRSVFFLPPPRPLNYLVGVLFRGPTLVLQVGLAAKTGTGGQLRSGRGKGGGGRALWLACAACCRLALLLLLRQRVRLSPPFSFSSPSPQKTGGQGPAEQCADPGGCAQGGVPSQCVCASARCWPLPYGRSARGGECGAVAMAGGGAAGNSAACWAGLRVVRRGASQLLRCAREQELHRTMD